MKSKYPVRMLSYLKSGSLKVSENGKPSVEVVVDDKKKVVHIIDLSFAPNTNPGFFKKLSDAKEFAKMLKKEDLTLVISDNGNVVMKLGKETQPKFSRLLAGGAVEIIDLSNLRKLDKRLRMK